MTTLKSHGKHARVSQQEDAENAKEEKAGGRPGADESGFGGASAGDFESVEDEGEDEDTSEPMGAHAHVKTDAASAAVTVGLGTPHVPNVPVAPKMPAVSGKSAVPVAPSADAPTELIDPIDEQSVLGSESDDASTKAVGGEGAMQVRESQGGQHAAQEASGSVEEPLLSPAQIAAMSGGEGMPGYVAAGIDVPLHKKHRVGKVLGIAFGVLVGLVAVAYLVGALVFSNWFPPSTTIGQIDASLKSSDEVAAQLEKSADGYKLDIVGSGFSHRIEGDNIGLAVDGHAIAGDMHEDLNPWTWPVLLVEGAHDETERFEVSFDKGAYETGVKEAIAKFNETAEPPTNATIAYDEQTNTFKVKEEVAGTQYDEKAVLASIDKAISTLNPKIMLTSAELIQPTVLSTDTRLAESAKLATGMVTAKLTLLMNGEEAKTIDGDALSQFVAIDDEFKVKFDDAQLDEWLNGVAGEFNTVGSSRNYMREDGKEITVAGGVYGWEVDTEALKTAMLDGVKSGEAVSIDIPFTQQAAVYNGVGTRDWGNRYIDIDLSEQYVRFYGDDGSIIWESACISGKPDGEHDTVPGVWMINGKKSPEKLIGYENGVKIYESYVTYWMPFEGNAIGLHDADWQPGFGGTMYADGYGSHGCVNLPPYKAAELYDIVEPGDVVSCHW